MPARPRPASACRRGPLGRTVIDPVKHIDGIPVVHVTSSLARDSHDDPALRHADHPRVNARRFRTEQKRLVQPVRLNVFALRALGHRGGDSVVASRQGRHVKGEARHKPLVGFDGKPGVGVSEARVVTGHHLAEPVSCHESDDRSYQLALGYRLWLRGDTLAADDPRKRPGQYIEPRWTAHESRSERARLTPVSHPVYKWRGWIRL